ISRRSTSEGAGEGSRRDPGGGVRKGPPLPQVAASSPRPAMAPRPATPSPTLKTQRPEKSMTREEVLELMRTGRLQGPGGGPAAAGSTQRTGHPQRPGTSAGSPRGPGLAPPPSSPARRGPSPPGSAPVPPLAVDEEEEKKSKGGRLGSAADRAGRRARRSE